MPIPKREQIKSDILQLLNFYGPSKTSVIFKKLSEKWSLTEEEKLLERSGEPLYKNEIRWARQELKVEKKIASPSESGHGVWQLADTQYNSPFSQADEDLIEYFFEGAKKAVLVNAYERNPQARQICLDHYGYICRACKKSMEEIYGESGKKAIHVHHVIEISSVGKEYIVDPIKDLVPVCPNCHHIIHRRKPPYSIHEVSEMLKNKT